MPRSLRFLAAHSFAFASPEGDDVMFRGIYVPLDLFMSSLQQLPFFGWTVCAAKLNKKRPRDADEYRARLSRFYAQHAPEKLDSIDEVLDAYG